MYDTINATTIDESNYTVDLDNGFVILNFDSIEHIGTVVTANYSYLPDTYINQSGARNLSIIVIAVLFILGIFGFIRGKNKW